MKAMVLNQTKVYVRHESKPEDRRNEMQVLIQMLQRSAYEDGSAMIRAQVIDLAQALLIAGVKEVPSIEMISKTIRRSKNVGNHLKESLVHHLESSALMDVGTAKMNKKVESNSSSESEEDEKPVISPARTMVPEVSVKTNFRNVGQLVQFLQKEDGSVPLVEVDRVWESNLLVITEKLTINHIMALIEHYENLTLARQVQARAANAILLAVDPKIHGEIFKTAGTTTINGSIAIMDLNVAILADLRLERISY